MPVVFTGEYHINWKILANTVILVILTNTGHTGQLNSPTWKTYNNQTVNIHTLLLYLPFKYFSSAVKLLLGWYSFLIVQ